MTIRINKKIVSYKVAEANSPAPEAEKPEDKKADVIQMHEALERPDVLIGSTYKIKPPESVSEHALYITINDIVLNPDTEHELRRPFEIFINSKNMDHFQWIVALTKIISAVFRKGGDVAFLVEELRSVFDPRGGYWNRGKYTPSLIAEIGNAIEQHLVSIGMMPSPELDPAQKQFIDAKRAEFELTPPPQDDTETENYPANASLCKKCHVKASIVMDGCMTCLNCGDSKCG